MSLTRVVLAGAAGGAVSVLTSWLITGYLFHRYQRLTPDSWRPEGPAQYALSSAIQVLAGAALGLFFYGTGGLSHLATQGWLASAIVFGALAWVALACPVLLVNAVYIRLHRGAVMGLLLDSLVGVLLVSSACAWAAS